MKNKIFVIVFIIYISIFSLFGIIIPDSEISKSERRKLSNFPEFKFNSEWISDLDKYFLDHFVLRDEFRSLKAIYNYNFLNKLENNDIYLKDNYIFKSNYPTNKDSINNFNKNIDKLSSLFKNSNIYMMVIPDKNYYLDSKDFLHLDYEYMYDEVSKFNFNYIDIKNILNLNDYYETDTHWKQENLNKVVSEMSKVMNFKYQNIKYKNNVFNNFYGVYYGESAINRKPEQLTYLTSDVFDDVTVKYLENSNISTIYNLDKLNYLDAYEVYLDGASSFIEINNPNVNNNSELIVFRDSFGSSLIPLLVPFYNKIIVIDNRYISSVYFTDLIDIKNQEVLFMYSTLFINSSGSLKG